jgi:penicillin-binding protein 1C
VTLRGIAQAAGLVLACTLAAATARAGNVPAFDSLRAAHTPSDRTLFDRHGEPIQLLRVDTTVRRGDWLALDQISPAMRDAIVLSEDRRFWAHSGVDWPALAASAWANAWNQRTRGASTLTMQLAGLIDDTLARPAAGRSVQAKLGQIVRARQIEAAWTKAQILEAYLNLVPLRGELVGAAAAAQQLFGKHASGLDRSEAALLAVLVRAPNAPPAQIERRACQVLREQALPCDGLGLSLSQALARRPGPAVGPAAAPHYARWLARHAPPAAAAPWRSTLDARLQRLAAQALRQQLAELRGHNVEDGAVVVLDNASGEVLVWVGSAGPSSSSAAAVDAVLARRQPGSTLKPFVYGLALQQRLITAASVLDDSPLQLAAGGALYAPQNYDRGFKGPVSARTALAGSLNVPAVRVAQMVGNDALFAALVRAGLAPNESAGYHGHALALGSADVRLIDLVRGYRALARGELFGAGVAHIVGDMLADRAARAITFGLDSPLVTRGWAAVKTGTSKDLRDNWCLGWTGRYTVGVWVGNASGEPMHAVSGTQGAAPVWRALVAALHADEPGRAPAAPAAVVASNGEWFLAGTQPDSDRSARTAANVAGRFGIQSPREGTVLVLDPDIPRAAQRVVFSGASGRWFVGGLAVGSGERVSWQPRPGRHVLERHGDGGVIDRVRFEVRATTPGPSSSRRGSGSAGPPAGGPLGGWRAIASLGAHVKSRSTATSITIPHTLYSSEPISAAVKPATLKPLSR